MRLARTNQGGISGVRCLMQKLAVIIRVQLTTCNLIGGGLLPSRRQRSVAQDNVWRRVQEHRGTRVAIPRPQFDQHPSQVMVKQMFVVMVVCRVCSCQPRRSSLR
jgi:hypothetical protein